MTEPHFQDDAVTVFAGDCLDILKTLDDNSVDSVVTDPPAGISFMSKNWDHDKGGRTQWVAWMTEVMTECHRILKPGGHALVWGLPRTSHWTALAIEDAGFDIRDCITHLYGSGFPKSLNVALAIDKAAGATGARGEGINVAGVSDSAKFGTAVSAAAGNLKPAYTDAITPEVQKWTGWGTALKPASEHWWLARKPLEGKTVAANVLAHGTGALNVDGCRIGTTDDLNGGAYAKDANERHDGTENWRYKRGQSGDFEQPAGRWPANVVLDPAAAAELDRQSGDRPGMASQRQSGTASDGWGTFGTVAREVDGFNDTGGASRFFKVVEADARFMYVAKANSSERPRVGVEGGDAVSGGLVAHPT